MHFDGGPGVLSDKGVWTVPGRLATHGREVELDLVVLRDALAFKATTSFDRAALGVKAPRFMIGRRIEVTIVGSIAQGHSGA